jgi:hypothetical protein
MTIIYTVDLPSAGDLTVTGTITTDGSLGTLTAANFLNWDFIVSSSSLGLSYEITPANTTLARFEGITATDFSLSIVPPAVMDIESSVYNQVIVTPVPPGGFAELLRVSALPQLQITDVAEIGLFQSGVQLATRGTAVPLDHWTNTHGGNWSSAANWNPGVPTAGQIADIDATGTYSVAIATNDVAYGLWINDAQATVSDNNKGSLTLAGQGGAANPNGSLNIDAGTVVLNGGTFKAGTISISGGSTFLIAQGTYTGSNALSETIIDDGSLIDSTTTTITGNIEGTGTILAENKANLTIAGNLTAFTGSFTIANKAVLEFGGADSEPITFASGSSGTVKFDQSLTEPTGTISGLTPQTKIDLADLPFTKGQMTAATSLTATGGTLLTVTNRSTNQSVSLNLAGDFTNATWTFSKDGTGGTLVVDPPAPTSTNNGPPGLDHVVALFNQFIAAGFPDHNGTPITNALSQIVANEQQFLAQPHHG